MDGKQPGDPVQAAQVFIDLAYMDEPPAQLLLGAGVLTTYREKLTAIEQSLNAWEAVTQGVDFAAGE